MKREIVKTKDNSTTLFVPELDEHYHSIHGAMQEAKHIFIEAGLEPIKGIESPISILEIGFGTGLNSLLTQLWANKNLKEVEYTGLEKYPVLVEEVEAMNYSQFLSSSDAEQILNAQHSSVWGQFVSLSKCFSLKKIEIDFHNFTATEEFDLIYFDAFAPSAQADLWTIDIFKGMYAALRVGGVLVTYCVKGEVRRNMKAAGFEVEKIPGPPGKREMARAYKR
jgi:tRNA U34 5-methylaminomethyl-2-thiouridine-forming methyltransferase MnmC